MRFLLASLPLLLLAPDVQAATKVPNTLPCKNFLRNSDGSWTADPYTRAFDIGTVHNYRLESANIAQGEFNVGGTDLWQVIEDKCNTPGRNATSNSVGTFAN